MSDNFNKFKNFSNDLILSRNWKICQTFFSTIKAFWKECNQYFFSFFFFERNFIINNFFDIHSVRNFLWYSQFFMSTNLVMISKSLTDFINRTFSRMKRTSWKFKKISYPSFVSIYNYFYAKDNIIRKKIDISLYIFKNFYFF